MIINIKKGLYEYSCKWIKEDKDNYLHVGILKKDVNGYLINEYNGEIGMYARQQFYYKVSQEILGYDINKLSEEEKPYCKLNERIFKEMRGVDHIPVNAVDQEVSKYFLTLAYREGLLNGKEYISYYDNFQKQTIIETMFFDPPEVLDIYSIKLKESKNCIDEFNNFIKFIEANINDYYKYLKYKIKYNQLKEKLNEMKKIIDEE